MSKKIIAKIGAAALLATIAIAQISTVVSAFSDTESSDNNVSEAATVENSTVETAANQELDPQDASDVNAVSGVNGQLLAARAQLKAVLPGANVTVETVADLVDTVNNAEMDKTITLGSSFPTALTGVITLNITHNYNITIDGADKELTVTGNFKHFDVTSTGSGTLTFEAIKFKGRTTLAGDGMPTPANPGGGISLLNNASGAYAVNDCHFSLIYGSGINLRGAGRLSVDGSTFNANASFDGGGAIRAEDGPRVFELAESTFINNLNVGAGYDGGAVFVKNASGTVDIEHSLFLDNTNAVNRGGALAINMSKATNVITIEDSFFSGNEALSPASNLNADGGAISLFELPGGASFSLKRSTFSNNVADDDGGAMLLQAKNGSTVEVINSTFYKNNAYGKGNDAGASGGAIQAFASGSLFSTTTYTFINNTFADNASYSNAANQEQRGGAIAGSGSYGTAKGVLQNNITIGNKVYKFDGSEDTVSKYQNVSMASITNNGGNIGLDNGNTITATYEDVFGVYPVLPCQNRSEILAGNLNDASMRTIPTMPIIPNNGITGIANGAATISPNSMDEREVIRSNTFRDSGAVEIGWIRYNGNGGQWSLPELTAYTGDEYYVGTTPTDYYDVGKYGEITSIIDDTNLSNGTKVFVEWNTAADGSGTTYTAGDTELDGDGLTLYAIWADPEPISYSVTYDGNGNTGGSAPVDSTAYASGATATVLAEGTLVRDGYTFTGWNTMADGSGTSYGAGDTLTVTGNVVLYAQWLQGGESTDNNETTTNNSDADLPSTGANMAEWALLGLGAVAAGAVIIRKAKK